MPVIESGRYIGGHSQTVEVNGQPLEVTAHFAHVRGHVRCVGLDIRGFSSVFGFEAPEDRGQVLPVQGRWTEITSLLVRGVHAAAVIEKASAGMRSGILAAIAEEVRPQIDAFLDRPAPRRRGPKAQLDDVALRDVVAPAYRAGGRKPVQAVRNALATSEQTRPIFRGVVSKDQASKAVVAARRRGFLPPADRSRRHMKEQA